MMRKSNQDFFVLDPHYDRSKFMRPVQRATKAVREGTLASPLHPTPARRNHQNRREEKQCGAGSLNTNPLSPSVQ
eukprot:769797-Prymnesium_polylepis.2